MNYPEIERHVQAFENQSLSKTDWTHEMHLVVGCYFVKMYGFEDAVCRLRAGIILLNRAHGTANHVQSGYHETITIFWADVFRHYISLFPEDAIETLVNRFLNSPLAGRSFPFQFYTRELLLSAEYRAVYHAPDLRPLDLASLQAMLEP